MNLMELLVKHGPLTGKELIELTGMDLFALWKCCNMNPKLIIRTIGQRYLRFDKQVEDYARLSPSIMREFHGYTVIGTEDQHSEISHKAEIVHKDIIEISRRKFKLALEVITRIVEGQTEPGLIRERACFLIAGDVAYEMSHAEPRPEVHTGELVRGSDLDLVVVTKDLPDQIIKRLDTAMYDYKLYLLKSPIYREEMDYVIKDMNKVKTQLEFLDFKCMIASKVLHEAKYLYGSDDIYQEILELMHEKDISQKISRLEKKASVDRENARIHLLGNENPITDEVSMKLFYTKEEKEEFF